MIALGIRCVTLIRLTQPQGSGWGVAVGERLAEHVPPEFAREYGLNH